MAYCMIDSYDFLELVHDRLKEYWNWDEYDFDDNPAWNCLCTYIDEDGNAGRSVKYVADNFHINGDYGHIDEYVVIPENCSEEERQQLIDEYLEANEDSMLYYDSEHEFVIYSLGI